MEASAAAALHAAALTGGAVYAAAAVGTAVTLPSQAVSSAPPFALTRLAMPLVQSSRGCVDV